jgi:hypothetical protein
MPEEKKEEQNQFHTIPHQNFMKDPYFRKWYPKWINNAMENYPIIMKEFKTEDRCISCLPRPMNRPCMILGSGPSLDKAAPLLKDWKNPIFSSSSTAFVPVRWGRKPDYMCAFDSLWSSYNQHLKLDDKKVSWEGTTLFTHPNAEPMMIKTWKWDKYYYRRVFPGHEFFEFTFPLMFPWVKVGVKFSGCVANNALTLAAFFGFNPIVIVGIDFGWRDDGNTKATSWKPSKDGWEREPKTPMDSKNHVPIIADNGIHTHPEYFGFKSAFLDIYASHQIEIIDCSDGIIEEFPKVSIEEIIETQGWGNYNVNRKESIMKVRSHFDKFRKGEFEWQKKIKK